MKFEFAHYTDVTSFAKKHSGMYADFEKVFICPDTNDVWVARVSKDLNADYERDEGKYLIERNRFDSADADTDYSVMTVLPSKFCKAVLDYDSIDDGLSSWDTYECDSMEEVLSVLSDIFGIYGEDDVCKVYE